MSGSFAMENKGKPLANHAISWRSHGDMHGNADSQSPLPWNTDEIGFIMGHSLLEMEGFMGQ